MTDATTRPLVNIDELELVDSGHGEGFATGLSWPQKSLGYWDDD